MATRAVGGQSISSGSGASGWGWNNSCAKLLSQVPQLAPYLDPTGTTPYFSKLEAALEGRVVYDGLQSSISQYDAGMYMQQWITTDRSRAILQGQRVCWIFNSDANGTGRWNTTVAAAQLQPPGTDIYLFTGMGKALGKSSLQWLSDSTSFHEALHNLTGFGDDELYLALTHQTRPAGTPTAIINQVLIQNGCSAE